MTHAQAIKILVEIARQKAQHLSVDANLYEVFYLDTPGCKSASDQRNRIMEAIQTVTDSPKLV